MRWLLVTILLAGCHEQSLPREPPSKESSRAGYEAIARQLEHCGSEPRIVLNAEAANSPRGPVLIFRLTNVSKETLVTYPQRLPWGHPNSIEVAASTVSGQAAPTFWPLIDLGPTSKITIGPGESLVGQAELAQRIPDLAKLQSQGDVLISWSYRVPFVELPAQRCVSGIAVLSRLPN